MVFPHNTLLTDNVIPALMYSCLKLWINIVAVFPVAVVTMIINVWISTGSPFTLVEVVIHDIKILIYVKNSKLHLKLHKWVCFMFMLDKVKGLAHGCKLTEMSSNSADPLNSAEHFSVSQLIIWVSLPSNLKSLKGYNTEIIKCITIIDSSITYLILGAFCASKLAVSNCGVLCYLLF